MTRIVGFAGAGFLLFYAAAAVLAAQRSVWLGNLAELVPPLGYAGLAFTIARLSSGQVRVFWSLNALHGFTVVLAQAVWTYYDLVHDGVPLISPSDPIFFVSSVPLAAALYGRPDRERPRWLLDIVLFDIVLIGLFAIFVYVYFIVSLELTSGPEEVYRANLRRLFNARNLLLAAWAAWIWRTASSPRWRRVLGVFSLGLTLSFVCGLAIDTLGPTDAHSPGTLWALLAMTPYVVLALAPALACDARLLTPAEPAPPMAKLPVVSLIAITLLVLIPTTDEITRRLVDVSPAAQALRTRLALTIMIPFGLVVVVREFLSRRALLRAGHELLSTREQLAQQEKLAAVGQLVSGVAHELNNPLQGVLGYAELLSRSLGGQPESEELRAIRESATRAAGIVRNLLTFAGSETPTRSWQQINGIVQIAVAKRAPFLEMARTRYRVRLADRLPLLYLDSTRFEQVIINLIENAEAAIEARRSRRTGSKPEAAREPGYITIETRRAVNPDRIMVEVGDNGIGVPAGDLSKLFDPFFTTKATGEGQGLGLSVCYGVVREHGGTIEAHNREDGGAVFVVELPVTSDAFTAETGPLPAPAPARGPVAVAPAIEAPPSAAPRKPRALVIDDEDSNAALVRRVLDQSGYEADSTTLSRRALVMIERTAYDVVISDIRMPELGGPELYARACQIRPEMARRFIFITGDIDGAETLEFLERSRCGYFMKPFNLERLTRAVDMLVGGVRDEVH